MTTKRVCCTIDYKKIKRNMDKWRESIQTGNLPEGFHGSAGEIGTAPVEALVRKIDEGIEEATFPLLSGDFVLRADEQAEPVFYGKGTAPQPLDIFLAGLGMCMASIYGEGAADLGITIDSVQIRVRGDLALKGIFDFDNKGYNSSPGFSKITYTVEIESTEEPQKIRELVNRVERCCPAHNTVVHGSPAEFMYVVNGQALSV